MKPYVTNEQTKRQCWKTPPGRTPMVNHGKAGKTRAVRKWRSRKSMRRLMTVVAAQGDLDDSYGF